MKHIMIVVSVLILLLTACEDNTEKRSKKTGKQQKQTAEAEKPAMKNTKTDTCDMFTPPWGDAYWETWGKKHPREFELWYGSIVPKMKQVTAADIKKCSHLDNMFIGFTNIKDLSVFKDMKQLRKLDMRFATKVSDISPLSGLKNLEYLNIWKTGVSDLSPLTSMPKLKRLDAKMTPLSDISPLATIKSLEAVDVLQTEVADASPLAKLPNIKEVVLCTTNVKDISFLYPKAKQITYLDLCNTKFSDFEKLKLFSNLERLKLWGLPITDATLFSGMKNLWELDLWNTKITDIRPLYGLKNLKRLVLKGLDVPKKQVREIKKRIPDISVETKAK